MAIVVIAVDLLMVGLLLLAGQVMVPIILAALAIPFAALIYAFTFRSVSQLENTCYIVTNSRLLAIHLPSQRVTQQVSMARIEKCTKIPKPKENLVDLIFAGDPGTKPVDRTSNEELKKLSPEMLSSNDASSKQALLQSFSAPVICFFTLRNDDSIEKMLAYITSESARAKRLGER